MVDYYQKYLKYKNKYLELKGGMSMIPFGTPDCPNCNENQTLPEYLDIVFKCLFPSIESSNDDYKWERIKSWLNENIFTGKYKKINEFFSDHREVSYISEDTIYISINFRHAKEIETAFNDRRYLVDNYPNLFYCLMNLKYAKNIDKINNLIKNESLHIIFCFQEIDRGLYNRICREYQNNGNINISNFIPQNLCVYDFEELNGNLKRIDRNDSANHPVYTEIQKDDNGIPLRDAEGKIIRREVFKHTYFEEGGFLTIEFNHEIRPLISYPVLRSNIPVAINKLFRIKTICRGVYIPILNIFNLHLKKDDAIADLGKLSTLPTLDNDPVYYFNNDKISDEFIECKNKNLGKINEFYE